MLLFQIIGEEETILEIIIGTLTVREFFAYSIMGYIGLILSLTQSYFVRSNDGTKPAKFSLRYWWDDNYQRIIPGIFIVPLSIIFMEDWLDQSLSTMTSLIAGFSTDSIIEILKKRSLLFFKQAPEASANFNETELVDGDDANITDNNEQV